MSTARPSARNPLSPALIRVVAPNPRTRSCAWTRRRKCGTRCSSATSLPSTSTPTRCATRSDFNVQVQALSIFDAPQAEFGRALTSGRHQICPEHSILVEEEMMTLTHAPAVVGAAPALTCHDGGTGTDAKVVPIRSRRSLTCREGDTGTEIMLISGGGLRIRRVREWE